MHLDDQSVIPVYPDLQRRGDKNAAGHGLSTTISRRFARPRNPRAPVLYGLVQTKVAGHRGRRSGAGNRPLDETLRTVVIFASSALSFGRTNSGHATIRASGQNNRAGSTDRWRTGGHGGEPRQQGTDVNLGGNAPRPRQNPRCGGSRRRIIPFLMLCYFVAFLDRVNVSFAALQMNRDLGLTRGGLRLRRRPVLPDLLPVRSALEPVAVPVRRDPLDRAHHVHLGPVRGRHGVHRRRRQLLRDARCCWASPRPAFSPACCSS